MPLEKIKNNTIAHLAYILRWA